MDIQRTLNTAFADSDLIITEKRNGTQVGRIEWLASGPGRYKYSAGYKTIAGPWEGKRFYDLEAAEYWILASFIDDQAQSARAEVLKENA